MKRGLIVHVVNLLRLLQLGFSYAVEQSDTVLYNMCESVFSALMARDLRESHVEIPRLPCEHHIRVLLNVVGTGDEEWLRKII